MTHPIDGVMRYVTATAASVGAGNTDVVFRPWEGRVWEVYWMIGYQDDGAVTQSWRWQDSDSGGAVELHAITGAANDPWHFIAEDDGAYDNPFLYGPPVFTYDRYPTFRWTASGAGKNGYVKALVKEFRGIEKQI